MASSSHEKRMLTGVDSEYDLYADTPESERPGARRPVIDAPPDAPGRSRRATDHEARGAYRRLRDQFLRRWAASGEECFFGDGPIDYRLGHGDPRSPTVHHTIPVVLRPALELATSLWKPAHQRCNTIGEAAFGGPVAADADVPDRALTCIGAAGVSHTMTAPPVTVTPHWGGRSRDIKKE